MKATSDSPIDFLRKSLIVVALIGAILLLHQFAEPGTGLDPRGLLALGFVVLAAYTIGELAGVARIPHITGYLLAGIVFGPSTAAVLADALPVVRALPPLDEGILSERVLGQLGLVDSLALAMIALTAGGELKFDDLKSSFRHVLGTTLAMVGAVVAMVTVYAVVVLPHALPVFHALEPGPLLALAVVMAVLAAATSPAVSIAVVNSTGARGPVATTVLTGVVVGEITVVLLFSATSSVALGMLGGTGSVTVIEALASVGASIGVGAVVGVWVAAYLRFIAQELLLFLVSTIFVTTFVIRELHGEAAVAFITAGLIVGNFSDRGELLIREVERLSRPVYVVFFALAGAHLHLGTLRMLLLPALGLFAVRALAVFWGARYGARATNAPATVQAYAWMGFVSQAGLAIALAGQARDVLPSPVSESLYSMAMSVIALCELVGPLVLQTGLRMAGEIPNGAPADVPRTSLPPTRDDDAQDPWGMRVPTGSEALDRSLGELEFELNALLEEHAATPLGQLRRDGEHLLRQLRREALRTLRRAATRASGPELASQLRDDLADNARQWRDLVRERPAFTAFDVQGLIEALDRQVAKLPAAIEAGVVDSVWVARAEAPLSAARRAFGRARNGVLPIRRSVDLHALGRFHLSGRAPAALEELAAGALGVELRLAEDIGALAASIADGLELAAAAAERGQPEQVGALLTELRASIDAGFEETANTLQQRVFDTTALASRGIGRAFAAIHQDAMVVGTLDLAPRARRYRRVYTERSAALAALAAGTTAGRALVQARHQQLALELELLGAEARFRSFVRRRAAGVAREVRQRGPAQLARVVDALAEILGSTETLLSTSPTAGAVSRHVRTRQAQLTTQVRDANAAVAGLATDLASERWISALLQELEAETQDLSESYSVPAAYEPVQRSLPPAVQQHEVDFRELVAGFVETRVARDLVDLTGELLERVRGIAGLLEDVERVAAFNLESSSAEIDVLDDDAPVPAETLELIRAMVNGAIGRSHHRLVQELEVCELTADQTEPRVVDAVMEQLASLREQLLRGRIAELRSTWLRDRSKGAIARTAEAWAGRVPGLLGRGMEVARSTVGVDRIEAALAVLGVPSPERRGGGDTFAAPEPSVEVPLVYRRLFSDVRSGYPGELPLEPGDLLAGRDLDLERLRGALTASGPLRTAAVVGTDLATGAALAAAVTRGSFDGVLRLDLRALPHPADGPAIERWLARIAEVEGHAVWIDNLQWAFERRIGGFEALDQLLAGVVADRGRNAWIVVADPAVWGCAAAATPLRRVFGVVVELQPLTVEELERAIMSRHLMSGYSVSFAPDDDLVWWLYQQVVRGTDRDRVRRRAWFRLLHAASAGVLGDALRLWVGSIRAIDDDAELVVIGAVPRPPLTRLAQLDDEVLVTLLEALRQGWVDAAAYARWFRVTPTAAHADLAALLQRGLLVDDTPPEPADDARVVLRVAPHLRGPLHRVLTRRGWS